jgi:magnesium chelatase subunit D
MFDAEGSIQDKDVMNFAQSVNRKGGRSGRSKNIIFSSDRGRYIKAGQRTPLRRQPS